MSAMAQDGATPLPTEIPGFGPVRPFAGAYGAQGEARRATAKPRGRAEGAKVLPGLQDAIEACGIRDGATLSFHHHLRNGDGVLNAVLADVAALGLKGIRVAASSIFPVHAPLVEHIRSGVVTGITTSYVAGPVAEAISAGALATPAVLQTHGGRARAIACGDLRIDAAFVAAPAADACGNINGVDGRAACGTLGYPAADVRHAGRVVAVTDTLVPFPNRPIQIAQDQVDHVVPVEAIGDPQQIASGTTRPTTHPVGLRIAETAARVVEASGLLADGFSFQTGAGGVSLAVAARLAEVMARNGVRGGFAAGGITGMIVDMLEAGLFRTLLDVQCFDLRAVESFRRNPAHQEMSASMYANPHERGAVVDQLDAMILGAAEVDLDFNVNVATATNGTIIGGSGGHSDTAAGSKLALVTTRLTAGRYPKIVGRVATVTTPGETVDAVATEAGVAVNPRRPDLRDRLLSAGIPVVSIEELRGEAERQCGGEVPRAEGGKVVAVVEYRDGTVIDVVREVPGRREGA